MTQGIAPHIYDPILRRKKPGGRDYLLHYKYNKVMLLKGEKGSVIPAFGELREEWDLSEQTQYLLSIGDGAYYCVTDMVVPESGGPYTEPLTVFRNFEPLHQAFVGIMGSRLYRWTQGRRFCSCCGLKTEPSARECALVCPPCGQTKYSKISSAVIVAITNGSKLLMSRYAGSAYRNCAPIAGFVEIRKTFEDCVHREVMEEVGPRAKNIHYYKSQPWVFSDMEMVGFTAELDGNDTICPEEEELCKAGWSTWNETVEYGPCISVGHEMMKAFKDGKIQ